jgi:hypothetical protein
LTFAPPIANLTTNRSKKILVCGTTGVREEKDLLMTRLARFSLATALLLCFVASSSTSPAANSPSMEEKVVRFCKKHLGKKVGNGQCSVLAWDALHAAGAKERLYPDKPHKGNYVWGKQVYLLEAGRNGPVATGRLRNVTPGCVIQYHNTKWVDGAVYNHHTSVVASVTVKEKKLGIYQQNVTKVSKVVESSHDLNGLKSGWIRIYRPIRR